MKKICVLTATRAEYGLLSPIIHALMDDGEFEVRVVATGAHLSPEFGLTYKEIEADGIKIHKKIEILLSADTPAAISKSMGMAMIGFADYFEEDKPDALLVLGDRYETLAVCCAAMNARIPIFHLYGGETTEGAVDEAVRHAITKLSYLHMTSTEEYRRRVIQLGESPDRVFTVGAIGIENALKKPLMRQEEVANELGLPLNVPYAIVTFHPVTLENATAAEQCKELMKALDMHPELNYIITKANADGDGRIINHLLEEYAGKHDNVKVFESLGTVRYLSALKYAKMVIGNSSSGLVEAPSFGISTINIGDRQKGRLKAKSVIDCEALCETIVKAIEDAMDSKFQDMCKKVENPYGDGHSTEKIIEIICKTISEKIDLKKEFYDVDLFSDRKMENNNMRI